MWTNSINISNIVHHFCIETIGRIHANVIYTTLVSISYSVVSTFASPIRNYSSSSVSTTALSSRLFLFYNNVYNLLRC